MTAREEPEITVRKVTAYIPVSRQILADTAFDLDAVLNPNWRQRMRGRLRRFRNATAERLYRLVSGHDLPEPEPDDWEDDRA